MSEQLARRDKQADELGRTLGVSRMVFMVVAGAAPLTVVVANVPLMIGLGNGTGAPLNYLVGGLVLLLLTVGFSAMTPEIKNAGAFYAYVQKGLGKVVGLGAATLALASYVILVISVVAYFGVATDNTIDNFTDVSSPWWLWSGLALLAIGLLGHRNIEVSANVLGILLIGEIVIVAAVDLAIVGQGGDSGLSSEPLTWGAFNQGAVGTGIMFAIFGFIGFEATAVFRSEAKDPDRTVPRATYIAVILIAGLYSVSAWALINGAGIDKVLGLAQSDPEGFTPDLTRTFVSSFARDVMLVLLVTSLFACVLTFHNVVTRYVYTLGTQGVLPNRLVTVHHKHRSPYVASAVTFAVVSVSLLVMALVRLDPVTEIYTWFSGAATIGVIALMALTALAILVHFRRSDRPVTLWQGTVAPALALIGLVVILGLVINNFELLIGSSSLAVVFGILMICSFVGGMAWAVVIRRTRPDAFAQMAE